MAIAKGELMKAALLAVCLVLSFAALAPAATARPPAPPTDPPGGLNRERLNAVTDLAARLSRDRGWLTAATLKSLASRGLGLDEIFDGAPRYVAVDGAYYRIKLQQVGHRWAGFNHDPDTFVVFLTHEVYDGLGEARALGYQGGEEMILPPSYFEKFPAVSLPLFRLTQDEPRAVRGRPFTLAAKVGINLGKQRPA